MKKRIPAMDLMFYVIETHNNPKQVGALQIFQMPPRARCRISTIWWSAWAIATRS